MLEGVLPSKSNEIVVSEEAADKLGLQINILGTSISIDEKEYTITGVVTHICGQKIEDLYVDDGAGDNMLNNVIIFSTSALTDNDQTPEIYMSGFGGIFLPSLFYQTTIFHEIYPINSETQLVSGRMPTSDNEILISKAYLELWDKTAEEVVGNVYNLYDLYEEEYGRAYWDKLNLYDYMDGNITVVGVTYGTGDYYITASLFDNLYESYKTYYEFSYYLLADDETLADDVHGLWENGVKIDDQNLEKVYTLTETIDTAKNVMIIVTAIIALLTVLQMISLYSYSISDSKHTIGILRTIGVNKSDTKKIFTIECLVISTLSFLMAVIISIFITYWINDFINQNILEFEGFRFLHMRIIVLIITGLVDCLLSLISVLIPIRKYSKMKIIELLKY